MSNDTPTKGERTIEKTLEIDAPVEAVWDALTDAGELQRWFPIHAEVEPGEGGKIFMRWRDYWQGTMHIEIWEPGRHLRTTWALGNEIEESPTGDEMNAPADETGNMAQLTVDYYLDGDGGTTTLRLVHSGFGKGADWDDWYDGTRRGWDYELECLRHYLENHRSTERHVAWARHSFARAGDSVFDTVFGPDGLLTTGTIEGLEPGAPYSLTAFDGTRVRGHVLVNEAGAHFAGTVADLNNACFRVESFAHGDQEEISVFVATWDVPEQQVRDLEARWNERLGEVYG